MLQGLAAFFVFCVLAQDRPQPAQTVGSESRTWNGTLIDSTRTNCGPETKGAAPSGSCPASVQTTDFALVLPDGKVLKLDAGGNPKAADALRKSRKGSKLVVDYWKTGRISQPIRARLTGTETSDTLNVESVRIE